MGYLLHFRRNHGIVLCQIRVGPSRVHNAETVPEAFKVNVYLPYFRLLRIFKINIDHSSHRGRHLIHQTARLSKIFIFRILACLG